MAEDSINIIMANLVLQIGVMLFVVRICGKLVTKIGIPSVLGELLAGIAIGPYALGGIPLPGFPHGLYPLNSAALAVSPELYGFSTVASILLLFASGLETDIALFLRYSIAGGIIGLGGVAFSFLFGAGTGMLLLHTNLFDMRCLFLGVMSTATSVGITARILSDHKKMDSPEGVTTLAAAVFDDVLGIVLLAVVLGIVAVLKESTAADIGSGISGTAIAAIAGRAFGIWLGFTAAGLIFAKKIASFLKLFKHSHDFSICAFGIAMLLAGFFEHQGLAMIIGAYITGLSLSGTDIAAVVQERIHGLYEFFVPLFFAVMGMMVNVREMMSAPVLLFGAVYTFSAILSKVLGCGLPALALGFTAKGGLRIGCGMIPRGEVALIIAGIGLTAGILDEQLFGVVILMTLLTTLAAAPLLNFSLGLKGKGTRLEPRTTTSVSLPWDFGSDGIADLVMDILLKELKSDGFYIQRMNLNEGLSQARKDDISLSIKENGSSIEIETAAEDAGFVKTTMYEVVLKLNNAMLELKKNCDPLEMKRDMTDDSSMPPRLDNVFKSLTEKTVSVELSGSTKDEVLQELVMLLANSGKVQDWRQLLDDVQARERTMSTGMQNGIALPHAKSDGVQSLCVAVGIKKSGIDFDSLDGKPAKIFVMIASPKKTSAPHLQHLASMATVLRDPQFTEKLADTQTAADVVALLRGAAKEHTPEKTS
ncbi:MAG: fructose PTS transporter subunit IIA [Bacteroides sp.]|nr:fructose PTS transporter subunit IIA [Prevotella sp.]MCM1407733.1 fructose PTS transporter subunit IIA [Treponema brennaborense]MCM1469117.1 fructose PTS transporter subunit IIA [Bacteroides sp.]